MHQRHGVLQVGIDAAQGEPGIGAGPEQPGRPGRCLRPLASLQQHAAHDHLKDRLDQREHLCHAGAFRRQPRGKLLRLPQQGAEPSPAQFHGGQQTVLMGAAQGVRRAIQRGKIIPGRLLILRQPGGEEGGGSINAVFFRLQRLFLRLAAENIGVGQVPPHKFRFGLHDDRRAAAMSAGNAAVNGHTFPHLIVLPVKAAALAVIEHQNGGRALGPWVAVCGDQSADLTVIGAHGGDVVEAQERQAQQGLSLQLILLLPGKVGAKRHAALKQRVIPLHFRDVPAVKEQQHKYQQRLRMAQLTLLRTICHPAAHQRQPLGAEAQTPVLSHRPQEVIPAAGFFIALRGKAALSHLLIPLSQADQGGILLRFRQQ